MSIIDNGAVTVQLFEGLVQFVTCVYCQTHHPVKFNSNAYTCINRVCCIFLDLKAFLVLVNSLKKHSLTLSSNSGCHAKLLGHYIT